MTSASPRVSTARPLDDVRRAEPALARAGVSSPRFDAEELAAHAVGTTRSGLPGLAQWPAGGFDRFQLLIDHRAGRIPLQHLLGRAYFRHLELVVGPGVFLPRPETELLVELVSGDCGPGVTLVDLCAGSGAVGLAVATEHPGTVVHLVEVDPDAVEWLGRNVAELAPTARVHPVAVAEFAAVDRIAVDVVTANPPYVPLGTPVEPEVAYDPALARWGGGDGLDVIREVVAAARLLLRPGGLLALEHDESHQDSVLELLSDNGFSQIEGHADLTGRPRFATGRAPGAPGCAGSGEMP